jgi:hypothetical protein
MLTKQQLQAEVQNLKTKLQEFQEQLNECKEVTIETAGVGDTLEDGSIVLKKENGLALLVAPKNTEVSAPWSKEFSEVFDALKSQGFNPSQWFIPTKEQLQYACRNIPYNELSAGFYWSSTKCNVTDAYGQLAHLNLGGTGTKAHFNLVRAFRCVTY